MLEDLRQPETAEKKNALTKRDHQYKRKGTTNVFCAVEPLTGRYFNHVTINKEGPEFAKALNRIARAYPDADTIHLIMDNYSTHTKKSLTDYYGEGKGNEIWKQFTVHYTPKNASWIDQAEIATGLYSRQCLGKDRIPDIDTLRTKTKAWNKAINQKKAKINWGFKIADAKNVFKY